MSDGGNDMDHFSIFGGNEVLNGGNRGIYVFNQAHDINIYGSQARVIAGAWFVDTITNNCADLNNINFFGVAEENWNTGKGWRDGLSCMSVHGSPAESGGSETLSSGTATVTFAATQPDTNYQVQVSCDSSTNAYITSKLTTGFTINGGTTDDCDWRTSRLSN